MPQTAERRRWLYANDPEYRERQLASNTKRYQDQERVRDEAKERSVQWATANPERIRIGWRGRALVQYYLKTGRLVRPDTCEECGKACKPDAAHSDYSQPALVRWLCRSCHMKWDHKEPKTT